MFPVLAFWFESITARSRFTFFQELIFIKWRKTFVSQVGRSRKGGVRFVFPEHL